MAIYEYHCPTCRKVFEVQRPMSESDTPTHCPGCGAASEKLVSDFASKIDYTLQVPGKEPFRQLD